MYKKIVDLEDILKVEKDEVIQIIYKGDDFKVLMTQEHYFNLLQKIERLEGTSERTKFKKSF